VKTILILILLIPLFVCPAYAQNIYEETAALTGVEAMEGALDDDARQISGGLKTDGSYDVKAALGRLWKSFIERLRDELRQNFAFLASLAAVGILCAAADSLCGSAGIRKYIDLTACCAAAVTLVGSVDSITAQTVQSLNTISDYSKAALPALFTAAAACGAVSSSAAKYAAVCLAMELFMSISQKIIIPLIYAYTALAVSNSLFANPLLTNVARLAKWAATTVMTGITIAFSAYIGMTGLVTGSIDAAAIRTTKTVISAALPVVGGIISDASATVITAARVIKNSAGVFGLIAACALCIGPFAALSIKMLALKAAAAVSGTISNGGFSGLIGDIAGAMGLLLGLLGCCGIMLFISIMAAIKAVGV